MDNAPTPQPPAPNNPTGSTAVSPNPHPATPKKLIFAIVAALIMVGGLAFLFLSPSSPLNAAKVPTGPKLLVGEIPYAYACSLVDSEAVGKALAVSTDKNKLAIEETFALAPANTKDKQLDLIKVVNARKTEDQKATSACVLKFDRAFTTDASGKKESTYVTVTLTADQFSSEKSAKDAYTNGRPGNTKGLGDLGEQGYFTPPATLSRSSTVKYVMARFLHKNIVFTLQAPAKGSDVNGETLAAKLAGLAKDVSKQAGSEDAGKPKNFSGANKVGENPLLDACASINYVKFAEALGGGSEFRPTRIIADKTLAPDDFNGTRPKSIESNCGFSFRTAEDIAALTKAENNIKSQGTPPPLPGGDEPFDLEAANATSILTMPYESKFPHLLDIRYFTTASSNDAQTLVKKVKEDVEKTGSANSPQQYKIESTTFGDGGVKVSTDTRAQSDMEAQAQGLEGEGSPAYYDTTIYYTAKGPYVYMVTAFFTRQDNPYTTTSLKLTDESMKKLSKVMEAGIRAGEKQAK